MSDAVLAVTDPFSSGRLLVRHLHAQGCTLVAVLSEEQKIDGYAVLDRELFARVIDVKDFDSNLDEIAAALKALHVRHVIAGSEPGVSLAEQLGDKMQLTKSNGVAAKNCRRDKFEMHEVLRENGLRCIEQIKSSDEKEILDWCRARNTWPVVVKPADSMGTDGVCFCDDECAVSIAVQSLVGKRNAAGQVNDVVLAQEFLQGEEYVVDSVSYDGEHRLVCVWKYIKAPANGAKFVYRSTVLVPFDDPVCNTLWTYITSVLSCLGIRWGPAHSEVMLTRCNDDATPSACLIETGARIIGGVCPSLAERCLSHAHIELTADVYTDGRLFREKPPTMVRNGRVETLVSYREGVLKSAPREELLKSLPSYYDHRFTVQHTGDRLLKTVDLWSTPGHVMLVSPLESSDQLELDAEHVHKMAADLFILKED